MKTHPKIIDRILAAISEHKTFCIVGHMRPDGDCAGSQLGLMLALRAEGKKVSSLHLQFLQPMAPGIKEIMQGFGKVMTIESNWSDRPEDEIIDENNRRYSSLAILLRARYLVDVDCWTQSRGQPIKPSGIRPSIP